MRETRSRTSAGPIRFMGGAAISTNRTGPSWLTLSVSKAVFMGHSLVGTPRFDGLLSANSRVPGAPEIAPTRRVPPSASRCDGLQDEVGKLRVPADIGGDERTARLDLEATFPRGVECAVYQRRANAAAAQCQFDLGVGEGNEAGREP